MGIRGWEGNRQLCLKISELIPFITGVGFDITKKNMCGCTEGVERGNALMNEARGNERAIESLQSGLRVGIDDDTA